MKKHLLVLSCGIGAGGALLLQAEVAAATTIEVTSPAATVKSNDGLCTLPEAIKAVNSQAASGATAGECPAGNGGATGSDNINLMASAQTYSLTSNLLVTRSVNIFGAGVSTSIIKTTAQRGFDVRAPSVFLYNMTISNGRTDSQAVYGVYIDGTSGPPSLQLGQVTIKDCTNGLRVVGGFGSSSFDMVTANGVSILNSKAEGVWVQGSRVSLEASIISGSHGSGIRNDTLVLPDGTRSGSNLTLRHTTVDGNAAAKGAGIWNGADTNLVCEIRQSTISSNTATSDGGGVYNSGGHFNLYDSTVSGNKAARGGGLFSDLSPIGSIGELNVFRSTLSNNTASNHGGGMYVVNGVRAITFIADIASGNFDNAASPKSPDCQGEVNTALSIIGNENGCSRVGGSDPWFFIGDAKLASLTDMGIPGATKVHPLLKGSPAIDQMNPTPDDEQRYMWRPEPQTIPSGGLTSGSWQDIGPYEYNNVWPYQELPIAQSSGDTIDSTGQFVTFAANATNDFITFTVPITEPGTYDMTGQFQRWNRAGIYQLQTADTLGGTYTNRGSPIDLYSSGVSTPELAISSITVSSSGFTPHLVYFKFRATGKNNSSLGYQLYLAYLKVAKR